VRKETKNYTREATSGEYYRCRLCNHAITSYQKHFSMGICVSCDIDIPDHIPYQHKHKYLIHKILKRGSMKSLEDHVKAFIIPIGKYKDLPLTEITDLDWCDWYVKSDFSSKWQKKLVNKYIDDRADSIEINKEIKQDEANEAQATYKELKNGAWVDENF
jgi:hypothetical protein